MKTIVWLSGLLLLIVAGKAAFIWSGAYNVAADEPHWKLTSSLMETVRDRSIAVRSAGITVPPLDDEAQIRAGAGNYDAMCAGCHLRPGEENSELRAGLYPAPPDLTRHEIHDPAAAFWVIKHGIKMSGMPAWGRSMEDEYIWGMVALLQLLPDLSEERYNALVETSGGHQHGGTRPTPEGADAATTQEPAAHSHDHEH